MQAARWFDGRTALDREVEVAVGDGELILVEQRLEVERISPSDLQSLPAGAGEVRLGRRSVDGWRLVLTKPVDPAIAALFPRHGLIDQSLLRWPMVAGIAATLIATAGLVAIIAAPYAVARHLPMSWERRMGDAYDLPADFAACDDERAQAILDRLVDRIDPSARADGLRVRLLDVDQPNAAALPGQRIVIFDGMFDYADSPDAVGAIIGHEIAHVRRRHVAAAMIRQMGIGTIVTLAGGGAVAGTGGNLLALRYTRSAEAEADDDAIAMLKRAGVDPRPTAVLFRKLSAKSGALENVGWLNSHPASAERAARFDRSAQTGAAYRRTLSPDDFAYLRTACGEADAAEEE